MNQEVKTINGYKIKDETARESIESINTDIESINTDIESINTDIDIINTSNPYYDEITYTKERHYNTDCYITTIPKYDNNNNQIDLYVGDCVGGYTPLTYAQKEYTTLTINASLTIVNNTTHIGAVPSIISNGEIIRQNDMVDEDIANNLLYLGIKADRSISEYKVNETTAQDMIDDGVVQAFDVYWKLVNNGVATDLSNIYTNEGNLADSTQSPRQCIGIKENGDIIILTCDGRIDNSIGLYCHEAQEILIDKGCVNAWNLDGGGSTSTTIKGSKLNRNVDENGTKDRTIRYTLNVKKQNNLNPIIVKTYSKIGEEKQNLIQQIIPYINRNKIVCRINSYGYEINSISSTSQFEPIKLQSKNGNDYSTDKITLQKINNNDEYNNAFKINKTGYFLLRIIVLLNPDDSGTKYIRIRKNNTGDEINNSGNSNYIETDKRGQIISELMIHNLSYDDFYTLEIQGSQGDKIYRASIMIEEIY